MPEYTKSKLGEQDLFFDDAGTFSSTAVQTSTGGTRTVNKINASHLPTTTTTRVKRSADNTVTTTTDTDTSLQELYDDVNSIGIPDNDTLENSGPGTLQIRALGVDTPELAADAVDGSKIADNSIDSEHYVDGSIDPEHLANDSVETAKINDLAVTGAKLGPDSVTNDKVADDAIGPENMDMDGSGTSPVSFPVLTGQIVLGGTAPTETFTITGAVVGDKIVMTKNTIIDELLERAAITSPDTLSLTHNVAADAGDIYDFIVFRAAT